MFKKFICLFLFIFISFCAKASANNNLIISNDYFSLTMPDETRDTYSVIKNSDSIFIYEIISEKSGFGGFAFGVKIFKHPKEYTNIPGNKKLGELISTNGTLYDVVLLRPSEIQYADKKEIKKNYNRLYEFGNKIEITGKNGNKYFKNQGMKSEDLYSNILKKYKTAIEKNWDSKKFKQEKLGYMYPVLAKTNKNLSDEIGYIYYDINSDGIDELIIGEKDNIYDIYTMVERKPEHVLSGGDVDKYYICNDSFLCNEYSSKQNENIKKIYTLGINEIELYPTITYIYDNKNYYFTYGNSILKEKAPKKLFEKRINKFTKNKLNFIPLTEFK